ncbi:DNA-directed RNA polymerases II and V subunit 8A [Ziziphus jujuba]|uniref:DNA-directed RNA polymerases II and V subunit 8A n=2 Tax=Ziziphus jujuba TaxID=326968 RepID=A0ABM4A418_ZIZJJ|nr:DNA-directed RNA polymerases II and V subunit 8A [Ziziphus jujuba]XP_048333847.1 DNA-directed RNA polymerases II and V subunit 8A [Ziziphus jujuba]XP_048333848.1 DNA-directed RNA polymerases II and V subunit 8A-like [Ziziphus jujuba var. spinosa]XP_048333849.1 DNA-directed RNA polymerases II and V subunit 8A [Ziziphus jujuba]XP_048333850.1 DNA-directed RNA polymerases II and V subunit 8A-like [Ziziphus jujuba var. spinosa]XP_060671480.1 DNA-directed RNA polymerases II and V subunit 8A [Zizi
MMAGILFDDIFTIEILNPNGEKFDKVTRIAAQSEKHGILMNLDVNTEIYPMKKKEKFLMVLSPTLNWNEAFSSSDDTQGEQKSLADKFEYVMHGLVYKISEEGSGSDVKAGIYASFGGLQMWLKGDPIHCTKFKVDQKLFLLIRKLP